MGRTKADGEHREGKVSRAKYAKRAKATHALLENLIFYLAFFASFARGESDSWGCGAAAFEPPW
jgi:hypothetical protein